MLQYFTTNLIRPLKSHKLLITNVIRPLKCNNVFTSNVKTVIVSRDVKSEKSPGGGGGVLWHLKIILHILSKAEHHVGQTRDITRSIFWTVTPSLKSF